MVKNWILKGGCCGSHVMTVKNKKWERTKKRERKIPQTNKQKFQKHKEKAVNIFFSSSFF
jgi:hypothetical protein